MHNGALVDGGALVGTLILDQRVDINSRITALVVRINPHDDARRVDADHLARRLRQDDGARIPRRDGFHSFPTTGDSVCNSGTAWRCMLEPISARLASSFSRNGNQRSRHADELLRRHVHVIDLTRRRQNEFPAVTGGHHFLNEFALFGDLRICLRNDVLVLFDRRQKLDLVGHPPLFHLAVRRFNKAESIHPRIGAEGGDQADIGTFRRLNGTDAPRNASGARREPQTRAVSRQTARPQGRQATLVGNFR